MSKSNLLNILTTTADFAFLVCDKNGVITSANPTVRQLFAKQEGEVEGTEVSTLLPELEHLSQQEVTPIAARGEVDLFDGKVDVADAYYLEVLAAMKNDGNNFETRLICGGQVKWLKVDCYKLRIGRHLAFSLLVHDISKRKQNEAKIHELNQNLEQKVAERTAELEQRTQQIKAVVNSCAKELEHINETYQQMKERQMSLMESLEQTLLSQLTDLSQTQVQQLKSAIREQLIASMNIYSEDQITDQKFLMAILKLNELFDGESEKHKNLKPDEMASSSQADVDDLLDAFGI